jgi:sugar diacid utilization regulator
VAEVHTRDHDALNRSRAHVRRTLIRDFLRGEETGLTASDLAILAYPLDAHHVAVLLPDMPEGAASQLANGLRTAAKAHQTLTYPLTLGSSVVWLCRHEPWQPAALKPLGDLLEKIGTTASVSNPGAGRSGFVACLRQAEETERIREAWGAHVAPPVIRYADAGLEILLMQDAQLARTFVDAELGLLAQNTTEAARLRETLEASFRFGSHVAAAEHLQLHEHTVRNRLHKAEELLGHSLQERRTELQVAVRLVRLLGDAGDRKR